MPATSDPASGSVTPIDTMHSADRIPGRYVDSCPSQPELTRCGVAMSVCTRTVTSNPPNVDEPSASANAAEASGPSPRPPRSTGTRRPNMPKCPIARTSTARASTAWPCGCSLRPDLPAVTQARPCGDELGEGRLVLLALLLDPWVVRSTSSRPSMPGLGVGTRHAGGNPPALTARVASMRLRRGRPLRRAGSASVTTRYRAPRGWPHRRRRTPSRR